jgi:hypothetical protein
VNVEGIFQPFFVMGYQAFSIQFNPNGGGGKQGEENII